MASVFASFILNGDPTIKQFGVGLATAVLLAGILVVTLAPGRRSCCSARPRGGCRGWLDKILPHISVEGETMPSAEPPPEDEDLGGDTGAPGSQEPARPAPA